jgi:sugar lactone lactonase YvrE
MTVFDVQIRIKPLTNVAKCSWQNELFESLMRCARAPIKIVLKLSVMMSVTVRSFICVLLLHRKSFGDSMASTVVNQDQFVPNIEILSESRDKCGESPVWSVSEQALYWIDIDGLRIHRFDWNSQIQETWELHERPGCIALSVRGPRIIVAAMTSGVFELELSAESAGSAAAFRCLANIEHPHPDMRFNDGRCDANGRMWVSTMVRNVALAQSVGNIFCLDSTGLHGPHVSNLITPNGMAFSPDSSRIYLSDSHPSVQRVWALYFDLENGRCLSTEQRDDDKVFVDFKTLRVNDRPQGRPDGAAVDSDGNYWICGTDAAAVHCFSHFDGRLLKSFSLPVPHPTMCCFGGPTLEHLFVMTRPGAAATVVADGMFDPSVPGAALVFVPGDGVRGRPEPIFSQYPV